MLRDEEWEVFYNEYASTKPDKEQEREKILNHYASKLVADFVDELEAFCNDPNLIYDAIGARHAITRNGQEIYGKEFDDIWKGFSINQTKPNEDQLKEMAKNNIVVDNRMNAPGLREGFHIEKDVNFPDFIKSVSILDQITNKLIKESGISKEYGKAQNGTISANGQATIPEFQKYIQANVAKLALEKIGTKFSMNTDPVNRNSINPAVLTAIKKYQNSLDYFEKHINNPNRFFVTMFEFDQYLAKDENRKFLRKNKNEKHRARDLNTMFVVKLANALTYSANQVKDESKINAHSKQDKDFVIKSISDCSNAEQKKILVERWIYVADYLVKQGNFLSAQSIIKAFSDREIAGLYNDKNNFSKDGLKVLINLQSLFAPNEKSIRKLESRIKEHKGIKMPSNIHEAGIIGDFIHGNEDIAKSKLLEAEKSLAENVRQSEARNLKGQENIQENYRLKNEVKELKKQIEDLEKEKIDLPKKPENNSQEKLAELNENIKNCNSEIERRNKLIEANSKETREKRAEEDKNEPKKNKLTDQKDSARRALLHYQTLSNTKSKSANESTQTSKIKFKYLIKPTANVLQKAGRDVGNRVDPIQPEVSQKFKHNGLAAKHTKNTAGIFGQLTPGKEVEILEQAKLPLSKAQTAQPGRVTSSAQEVKKEVSMAVADDNKKDQGIILPPLPRSKKF